MRPASTPLLREWFIGLLNAGWKPTLDTRAGLVALARANASSVAN